MLTNVNMYTCILILRSKTLCCYVMCWLIFYCKLFRKDVEQHASEFVETYFSFVRTVILASFLFYQILMLENFLDDLHAFMGKETLV